MGYSELIQTLEQLPEDRRAEIYDFAEFIATKHAQAQLNNAIQEGLDSGTDLDADVVFSALVNKYQAMIPST